MITIPIWVFVILMVLAGLTAITMLIMIVAVIVNLLSPAPKYEELDCPDLIEPDFVPAQPMERGDQDD